MKHIKITYKREVYERDIPTKWAELDADGLLLAARLWSGGIERGTLIARFFGLPDDVVTTLDSYLVYCLTQLTDWMQRLDDNVATFIIDTLPGTIYRSPGPRLGGCTLEQFMIADSNFQRYAVDQDPDRLTAFIAALYHAPRRADDDLDLKTSAIEQLGEDVRQAVFLNFILIRRWLSRSYPYLFPPSTDNADDDDTPKGKKRKKPQTTDWLAIFDAFMGDDVAFIERYKRMAALDAFRLMNRRIRQSRQPQ